MTLTADTEKYKKAHGGKDTPKSPAVDTPDLAAELAALQQRLDAALAKLATAIQIEPALVAAAKQAIADGSVTKDGRPDVKAVEKILGKSITASDRDLAWDLING